jgi:hypothetical protein
MSVLFFDPGVESLHMLRWMGSQNYGFPGFTRVV